MGEGRRASRKQAEAQQELGQWPDGKCFVELCPLRGTAEQLQQTWWTGMLIGMGLIQWGPMGARQLDVNAPCGCVEERGEVRIQKHLRLE